VLSGGASTRMGRDKATLDLAGQTLLDRTIERIPDDVPIIVSGPVVPVERDGVRFVREDPPGGGPVAGVDAALGLVATPVVVLLAADLPFVGAAPKHLAEALLREADNDDSDDDPPCDALMSIDADSRHQMLCAAYRTTALRDAIAANGDAHGASMRSVVARLRYTTLVVPSIGTTDDPTETYDQQLPPTWDIDTPEDFAAAVALLAHDVADDNADDDRDNGRQT